MRLNDLTPDAGSRPVARRVGRGIGSGLGKTCGRGHKGQKARKSGFNKVGFEGGQMPLQRRLPKVGFRSPTAADRAEIRLSELDGMQAEVIDLAALMAENVINRGFRRAKIILSGTLNRPVKIKGLGVTKGARAAIEAAGGSIED